MGPFNGQLLNYWMLLVFAIGNMGQFWKNMGNMEKLDEKSGSKMTTVDFMLLGEFTLFRIFTAQSGCIMVHPPKGPWHTGCAPACEDVH